MRDSSAKMIYSRNGKRTTAVTTTGTIMLAVYTMNLILKAPARTRLVGLEETRIAEAMLAMANWLWIQALGWTILLDTRVMYARNAVPDRMIGSFPMKLPNPKKKTNR